MKKTAKEVRDIHGSESKRLYLKAKKLIAQGKFEKAEAVAMTMGEHKDRSISMDEAVNELNAMEDNDQYFTFEEAVDQHNTVLMKSLTINGNKEDVIVISTTGLPSRFHESKHAYQHIVGELTYIEGRFPKNLDLGDELAGYRRQYSYDPSSVKRIQSNSQINNYNDMTKEWIQGIVEPSSGNAGFGNAGRPVYEGFQYNDPREQIKHVID